MEHGRSRRNITAFGRFAVTPRAALTAAIVAIFIAGVVSFAVLAVPALQDVKRSHRPSDVWVVDRNGVPLEAIRTLNTHRSLEWVTYDRVSPALIEALVKAEDRRFFNHSGVDFLAIASATRSFLFGEPLRGASTLTMQLVKSLTPKAPRHGSSWHAGFVKLRQMALAVKLELSWTKSEILEAYLNRVSFRGEVIGLQAAALGFFRKEPEALDRNESALLVALLRSPNAEPIAVARRACRLTGVQACEAVTSLTLDVLSRPLEIARERTVVPVVSKKFIESSGSVIRTTLDAHLQTTAMSAVKEQLRNLKSQNVRDAALLVLETKTGRPLAYIANGGPENSTAVQVDGVQSRRQLGSTIKAFVFGAAFEQNIISSTSLLLDSSENVSVGNGQVYQPRNYDHIFRGQVGAAEALGSSLNVPAVRVLDLVGERAVLEKLRALGFEKLKGDDDYGPSLALGTVDATLWELAQGYRQLSLSSESNVFSVQAKQQIFESLSVPENRRFTFGVESLLQLPFAAAVKTGTSKDMRDNWCVGFTSEYTVAVWVGNFDGEPMWNVSGLTGAAPLWRQMMLHLHRDRRPTDRMVNYRPPDSPLNKTTLTQIRYPVADMLIGLDPDIPKHLQLVPLSAFGRGEGLSFFVNNRKVGPANETRFWQPVKGRHKVALKDKKGSTLDEVSFTVR